MSAPPSARDRAAVQGAHLARKVAHSVSSLRGGEGGLPADLLTPAAIETRLVGTTGFPDLADSVCYDPTQGLLAVRRRRRYRRRLNRHSSSYCTCPHTCRSCACRRCPHPAHFPSACAGWHARWPRRAVRPAGRGGDAALRVARALPAPLLPARQRRAAARHCRRRHPALLRGAAPLAHLHLAARRRHQQRRSAGGRGARRPAVCAARLRERQRAGRGRAGRRQAARGGREPCSRPAAAAVPGWVGAWRAGPGRAGQQCRAGAVDWRLGVCPAGKRLQLRLQPPACSRLLPRPPLPLPPCSAGPGGGWQGRRGGGGGGAPAPRPPAAAAGAPLLGGAGVGHQVRQGCRCWRSGQS